MCSIQCRKVMVVFVAFIFMVLSSSAQKNDWGMWYIYFGNKQINSKINWHHEAQYRNFNIAGDLDQLLLRTAIGYQLNPSVNLSMGYAFVYSRPYNVLQEKFSTYEHRPYQQLIIKNNYGRIALQHRYRLEERFVGSNFRLRFRYFLSANIPLNKKLAEPNAWYLSAYNEIFIHAQKNAFDRNRLYGGVGYVLHKNWKMELGVMTQMMPHGSRPQGQLIIHGNMPSKKD